MKDLITELLTNEKEGNEKDCVEVIDNDSNENIDTKALLETIFKMHEIFNDDIECICEDEDKNESGMNANDYHNKACLLGKKGKNKEASLICQKGYKHFPNNIDLLADVINYAYESGDKETALKFYKILNESIPFKRWTWRAYNFSLDFLIENDPVGNEEECREIIKNYKENIPHDERAYVAESKLETALGNHKRSMIVLNDAIHAYNNACQSALLLADMQLEHGLYEDVILTTTYGIAASAESQPAINIPYLYYIRAIAKDHIIHRKEYNNENISEEEIIELTTEYEMLLSKFPELIKKSAIIKTRINMLCFIKAT